MARPQKFRLSPDDVLDPQNARKLAGHVAEIEFFRGEVEKLQAQIAGVYDAADEEGFDKKFIRKVVAIRAKDDAVAQAEQVGIDAYTEALEIGFRSRARVENPEHDPETGEITDMGNPISNESEAAMLPQTGGRISAPATSAEQVAVESSATHTEPEAIPPVADPATVASVTGDGERTASSPDAFPGATNVTAFRTHNPATHFLNSKGLPRLHGCLKADACGGSHRALCHSCLRNAETASHQGGAA